MSPEDDRLIADLVSPLVARTETLAHQVEGLIADIVTHTEAMASQVEGLVEDLVTLEGALRRRLHECRCRPRGGGR